MRATGPTSSQREKTDRLTAARVARTDEALRRVDDWARRFARNMPEIPVLKNSLEAAIREIEPILRDMRFQQNAVTKADAEARARQITLAACKLIDALALVVPAPKTEKRKIDGSPPRSR